MNRAECSDAPWEIAEDASAHVEGSASERAYRLTDYFERRRALMPEWASYVLGYHGRSGCGLPSTMEVEAL